MPAQPCAVVAAGEGDSTRLPWYARWPVPVGALGRFAILPAAKLTRCNPRLGPRRLAAQHGLAWLRSNYWQRQSDNVAASKDRIRAMVQASLGAAPWLSTVGGREQRVAATCSLATRASRLLAPWRLQLPAPGVPVVWWRAATGLLSPGCLLITVCVLSLPSLQEYLLLHQAAAAKVAASSAAGDSDDSDDEEGRPSAAAAAVAAAASVSAGRKAARGQGGGYGAAAPAAAGDAGPTTSGMSGGGGGGYQAADAKKRRKQLLAEFRSAVPKPAAALLAEAVLEATADAKADGDAEAGAARTPAAPPVVADRALAAAMGHLCSLWPQLPPLLLAAAVRQLAAAVQQVADGAADSSSASTTAEPAGTASAAAAALAWVRRLLPGAQAAAQQQQQPAVAGAWQPSGALLRQLLADLLPAQAAMAQHAALQSLRQSSNGGTGNDSSNGSTGELAEAVQQAYALLVAAAKAAPGGAAAVDLLSSTTALSSTLTAEVSGAHATAQLAAAAQRQQALLQQLAEAPQLPGAGNKRRAPSQQAASAGGAAGRKRWRRAEGWLPCAIGMLPSPADPNGELPPLDAAAQLCLPASFLLLQQQQAAAAAAAAAGRASGAAGQGRHEGLVQAERAQLAAAAEAAAAGAPWPATDRFSRAVVAADDTGAQETLPAAPPVLLPASPAAFLL